MMVAMEVAIAMMVAMGGEVSTWVSKYVGS